MTVHDESGARLLQDLGVQRVVLARENTIDDIIGQCPPAPPLRATWRDAVHVIHARYGRTRGESFLPISELNRMRQAAVQDLLTRRSPDAASGAGARPAHDLAAAGVALRLRTPTIVRPEDRRALVKWVALDLPILSGHVGLAREWSAAGRDIAADYAVNCFNPHTAAELFARGVRRVTLSVELTAEELRNVVAPWSGAGFRVVIYGRPEGMTLEHCVLSAAFDHQPATCRDLCVQKHPVVALADPAGYTFPVATDTDCRNRLLHSRRIEASEFLPKLWKVGIRTFWLLFNVPGERIAALITSYYSALESLGAGELAGLDAPRAVVGREFTRGHFARAV